MNTTLVDTNLPIYQDISILYGVYKFIHYLYPLIVDFATDMRDWQFSEIDSVIRLRVIPLVSLALK
jgi:hypothetical protein